MTIDNKVNFSEHINIGVKKSEDWRTDKIKKFCAHGCENTTFQGCNTFLPLTYCHLTWHFCQASDKRILERIPERPGGLRAVIRDGQSTYEKLLNKAKLITLYEERLQQYYSMFDVKVKHGMTALRTSGVCSQ